MAAITTRSCEISQDVQEISVIRMDGYVVRMVSACRLALMPQAVVICSTIAVSLMVIVEHEAALGTEHLLMILLDAVAILVILTAI